MVYATTTLPELLATVVKKILLHVLNSIASLVVLFFSYEGTP
jgi:hypothetical protein